MRLRARRWFQQLCVRNHTQTHIHIHTSTSHTKAGPAQIVCVGAPPRAYRYIPV